MNTKYDQKKIESKWYNYWLENNLFSSKPNGKPPYTVLMPPPNVTGILHMGHMLNNTIQDVLVRRARMLGFNACWVPGTDHAAIATEAKVTEKITNDGIDKNTLSREDFLEHAWDWTDKHGGLILKQLQTLGVSCDWSRMKFTMDEDMSESVIDTFIDLYDKGLIYRDQKMINWDPKAKTAISDEEVVYKEQQSNLYYVDYKLCNSDKVITIATTRPETILGDMAICVNPNDPRYVNLIGHNVLVPLINRVIPIISDDYIDQDFGTGALKVTPAHDINDYVIGEKYNLEILSVIDEDGLIDDAGILYIGQDRFVVRKQIIKDIKNIGQLSKVEVIQNKVGFSERTNEIIEPRLSIQWFCKMDKLMEPALENVLNDNIKFYPKKLKNTYRHWMTNIRDWCLSRQLYWGHRIPAYYYNSSDFVVAKNKEEALLLARNKSNNSNLVLSELRQDDDVLDTWFSSWLWPITVFDGVRNKDNNDFSYYYPTSDLVTGHDILFFWVARMIIAGYEFNNAPPFKNVYFTGMVRDQQRRKMSKSLGNSPSPIDLINKYGADGVRSGMLFASPAGNDLLFDESLCDQGRRFSNKIWNAFQLINSWEEVEVGQSDVNKFAVDWFDNKFKQDLVKINNSFEDFKISDSLMITYKLIWDDFCSSYLEIIKPKDKKIDILTKSMTINFFENLLILLHPFKPFVTEELWQNLRHRESGQSIMYCSWPKSMDEQVNVNLLDEFDHLFKLVASIRNIRKEKNISMRQSIDLMTTNESVISFSAIVKTLCNINTIDLYVDSEISMFPFLVSTHRYFIPMTFEVNNEDEKDKITTQIKYLKGFLNSVDRKLSNKRFMDNAPDHVVNIEKNKREDTIIKLKSLEIQFNSFD